MNLTSTNKRQFLLKNLSSVVLGEKCNQHKPIQSVLCIDFATFIMFEKAGTRYSSRLFHLFTTCMVELVQN